MTVPTYVAIIISVCPAAIHEAGHAGFISMAGLGGTR
jgi:hypothetical protein